MKACFLASIALVLACGCASHKHGSKASQEALKSPYNIPLSTPGARFGSLPTVVQATVLSEAGTAAIYDVFRDISGDPPRVVYKIFFVDAVNYPPLWIGGDGSVLNRDLTIAVPGPRDSKASIPMSELPTTVLKVLQEHPPGAEILNIAREYWGDHQIYIISFKDDLRYGKLYVAADGNVIVQGPKRPD